MVKLNQLIDRLKPRNILVIGDLILDSYMIGSAKRLSPEAPVAIVNLKKHEYKPGGAGNVALNLSALGCSTTILGRVGNGWSGEVLSQLLKEEGIDTSALIKEPSYCTPVKHRIIADDQQIVRVDHEELSFLENALENSILQNLPSLMKHQHIIAISDYGKGFLTPRLLQAIFLEAAALGIPVVTDPKGADFRKYQGTTLIKPNLSEAYTAAGLEAGTHLELVASRLLEITQASCLMITRSQEGISLFHSSGEREHFPVVIKEVKDVTGAGDTVLAMLVFALANQLHYAEAAKLCNVAAGIAIEHVGCARVTLFDIVHRIWEFGARDKVFDQEHLFLLQEILKEEPFKILRLPLFETLHKSLFDWMKRMIRKDQKLVLFIEGSGTKEDMATILSSLDFVDFILTDSESFEALCSIGSLREICCYEEIHECPLNVSMGIASES